MVCESREPTLREALSDPIIRAVMAADRVDPAMLEADLRQMAVKISGDETAPPGLALNT